LQSIAFINSAAFVTERIVLLPSKGKFDCDDDDNGDDDEVSLYLDYRFSFN